jgi:hypothetical protein
MYTSKTTTATRTGGATLRWIIVGAALATLIAAETALAAIPQAQSGGGRVTRSRRACAECAADSLRRAHEVLVSRFDSLRWEVEHRRMTDVERELLSKEMARTARELATTMQEQERLGTSVEQPSVRRRSPAQQAYGYAFSTEVSSRGYLGVTFDGAMAEAPPPNTGRVIRFLQYPRIALVEGNSPAERAGVLVGDTVLALNGDDLREREFSFTKLLVPDAIVTMRVQRDGSTRDLKIRVGKAPEYYVRRLDPPGAGGGVSVTPVPRSGQMRVYADPPTAVSPAPTLRGTPSVYVWSSDSFMGARLETVTEGLGKAIGVKSGVLVLRSAPATPAYRAGLRDGDVVVRVGDDDVRTVSQMRSALTVREHDGEVKLVIIRENRKQDLTLRW